MKAPRPAPTDAPDEPLAVVEDMIARLGAMRQGTKNRALLGAYQAAIDRLHALTYGLQNAGKPRVLGLPTTPARTPPRPAGDAPQGALPLGPVVIARKPRRR